MLIHLHAFWRVGRRTLLYVTITKEKRNAQERKLTYTHVINCCSFFFFLLFSPPLIHGIQLKRKDNVTWQHYNRFFSLKTICEWKTKKKYPSSYFSGSYISIIYCLLYARIRMCNIYTNARSIWSFRSNGNVFCFVFFLFSLLRINPGRCTQHIL